MADPAHVTGHASPETAAPYVAAIQQAATLALDHFDQLPPGETGTVSVTLTTPTGYGVITLGIWTFDRAADGTVTLVGSTPEASDG
ncbi:hypothetical protein [Streptomyces variegatus]|uniref:hypothetical protein n=1 Tax=Streptomyces variegatus TaxID=284040 RepID=UPI003C30C75F